MMEQNLVSLVSEHIRKPEKKFPEEFNRAEPFPHLVLDEFLDPEFCRRLMEEFPPFEARHALNEYGEAGLKAVVQNLAKISPTYASLDRLLASREFLDLLGRMTGISGLLYDPDYIGGGTHENLAGQGLDAHVDFNYHPKTGTHRRLNLLLYLNPQWEASWGGSLELHSNPWLPLEQDKVKAILPVANRCVIFETSERSWHGFRNIQIPNGQNVSRRSVAVYFYTHDRPVSETAPGHATVYVHPKLPSRFQAGYTLQPDDVEALHNLIDRRDHHMQFLYEREKEFSGNIEQLTAAIKAISASASFRVGRLVTWPLRALRQFKGR